MKAVKREFDLLASEQDEGQVRRNYRQQERKQFEPLARATHQTIHRRFVADNR